MLKPGFLPFFMLLGLYGCTGAAHINASSPPRNQHRIVSLMPSLTEDLFAIGAGPQVIAVDQFSTDIPGAKDLPIVGNFSTVNTEHIVQLHADLVVAIPAQDRLLQPLARAGIARTLYKDDSFEDIFADLTGLGVQTGRARQAQQLIAELKARTASLHRSVHYRRTPSVFVVLNTNPIYTAGRSSYISTLIGLAGGRNAADGLRVAYAPYSAEALLRLQPDVIVTDTTTGLGAVLQNEPWRSLRAVAQHHVYVIDPADILERPGPRYNEGLSWLIAHLQPLAT